MTDDKMDKNPQICFAGEDVLECQPIKGLQELLDWEPGTIDGIRAESLTVPLEKHILLPDLTSRSKVLLCHDMKGGYQPDDRYCTDVPNDKAYRFYHWSQIDTFVYFSHNFVTIPPVPWVNAAHRNGVPILGTLITENVDLANQLFCNVPRILMIVQNLVALSKQHLLDGWLLNIENPIAGAFMQNVLLFVTILTTEMHEQIPGSQIIWYDSILYPSGRLHWQNELNEYNLDFFRACDGIFLNYNWNVFSLKKSAEFASRSDRKPEDVYVGIDVFGRGCFGGGGWNTRAAIDEIRKASSDLSLAIFAPGWVHENNSVDEFESNQCKFWNKLNLPERHVPSSPPIETSFCQGFGKKLFERGMIVRDEPWFNLSRQALVPGCRRFIPKKIFTDDAFDGGSCLRLSPTSVADGGHFSEPVIKCHLQIPIPGSLKILLVSLTFKPLLLPASHGQSQVSTSSPSTATKCPPALSPGPVTLTFTSPSMETLESVPLAIRQLNESRIKLFLEENNIPHQDFNGWKTLIYLIFPTEKESSAKILSEVWLKINDERDICNKTDVLIGQLKIIEAPSDIFSTNGVPS